MADTFQFIERARLLLEQGRAGDAIKQIREALQQEPDNVMALALFARCQFAQKDMDGGIATLQKVIAIDPENAYYFYLLGFGYYRKNLAKQAIEKLQESISINPYFPESFGLMAYVYCEQKDFKTALAKADEGLAVDPENITCLNARSIALNKMSLTDDAVETMQQALSHDPDNPLTHSTIGWNYLEKGNHKVAAKHFREALRIDPNMGNAKEGLKEALKSKIAPYRWLLQYSFWINNKAKKVRWVIPVGLYIAIRVLASLMEQNKSTEIIAGILIGLYLLFVLTSWIINPIANLFLLFHKDGKYALNVTEKYTAITVVGSLISGCMVLAARLVFAAGNDDLMTAFMVCAFAFWATALPLGKLQYPLSFNKYGIQNKIALVLVGLGILTIFLSFIYTPAAIGTGMIFLIIFAINSWVGVFR